MAISKKVVKKVRKKYSSEGIAHIHATFNNTMVTITCPKGNKISSSSAGANNFRGSKKSTPHAAKIAAEVASKVASECGVESVEIRVKGPGPGREMAAKAIGTRFSVTSIVDVTKVPHNGCRAPNERRV